MPLKNQIVRTKFFIPELPSDYVERKALIERVNAGKNQRLILVSASGGFGKSTLVSGWIRNHNINATWLSLSKLDNDLNRFILYFITSIRQKYQHFGSDLIDFLNAPKLVDLDTVSELLQNEIAILNEAFYLVLDDFHLINNADILSIISDIFQYPQPYFHLVISTRIDPAIPLAEWRAKNQLTDIRSADLMFRKEEIESFLEQYPLSFNKDILLEYATEQTKGWVTALRMLVLSLKDKNNGNNQQFPELQSSDIYSTLLNNVLQKQSATYRKYLLFLSLVHEFNLGLFTELCLSDEEKERSNEIFEAFINECFQSNIFISSLDKKQRWFRFHDLFREMLTRMVIDTEDTATIKKAYLKVGTWYENNNYHNESISCFVKGEEFDKAISIFKKFRVELINKNDWLTLKQTLQLFPQALINGSAELLAIQAWIYVYNDNVPKLFELMEGLNQLVEQLDLNEENENILLGEYYFFKGYEAYVARNEMEQSLGYCKNALELIPDTASNIVGFIWIFYGGALQGLGRAKEAISLIYRKLEEPIDSVLEGQLYLILCYIYWFEGNMNKVENVAQSLIDSGHSGHSLSTIAQGNYFMGQALFNKGNIEQATIFLKKAIDLRNHTLQVFNYATNYTLILCNAELGKDDENSEILHSYEMDVAKRGGEASLKSYRALRASVYWDKKKDVAALKWAMDVNLDNIFPILSYSIPELVQARILTRHNTEESRKTADIILSKIIQVLKARNNVNFLVRAYVIKTVLHLFNGEKQRAISLLRETLLLAEHGGLVYPIIKAGSVLSELLEELKTANFLPQFIGTIQQQISGDKADENEEPLTSREIEILNLINQNLSNRDIADRIYISEHTVKRHISNVNKKLQTNNRNELLQKAKSLALI